jgi:hypothetical protein
LKRTEEMNRFLNEVLGDLQMLSLEEPAYEQAFIDAQALAEYIRAVQTTAKLAHVKSSTLQ